MAKKFGGFLGDGTSKAGTGPVVPRDESRLTDYAKLARTARAAGQLGARTGAKPCFAIALDATGSMDGLINEARQSIDRILSGIYAQSKVKVRVRIYIYRDYDVSSGLCEFSELTEDSQVLSRWLASVRTHGGGANAGEAVEAALDQIYKADEVSAVLLAGDEPSNSAASISPQIRRQTSTAREWAPKFGEKNIPIHTFVVGDRADTKADFEEIARLSGGQSGRLDGSDAMIHMAVMAMLSRLGGASAVERYGKENKLSIAARDFSKRLIAGPR